MTHAQLKEKDKKQEYRNKFQYFDEDFYGFLTQTIRGNQNKSIRFKDKVTKTITPEVAIIIKNHIDINGLKYKTSVIKRLLDNHNIIQLIINNTLKYQKL